MLCRLSGVFLRSGLAGLLRPENAEIRRYGRILSPPRDLCVSKHIMFALCASKHAPAEAPGEAWPMPRSLAVTSDLPPRPGPQVRLEYDENSSALGHVRRGLFDKGVVLAVDGRCSSLDGVNSHHGLVLGSCARCGDDSPPQCCLL